MHVARLGASLLKGGRQQLLASAAVTRRGVTGDRRFCFVDLAAARVLRTVENPSLLALRAHTVRDQGARVETLHVDIPCRGTVSGPVRLGEQVEADYWGRRAALRLLDGPWGDAVGTWLGRPVGLAEALPGDVVYSGALTVTTTGSVAEAARRAGRPATCGRDLLDEAGRWRSNVVVDTGEAPPFTEDAWVGGALRLGGVLVRVRAHVPRCAVVRHRPGTGDRDPVDPLVVLAPDRTAVGEVVFGVDCDVLEPGDVTVGDVAEVVRQPVDLASS